MKTIIYLLLTFSLAHANLYKWIPEIEKVFHFEFTPKYSPDGLGIKTEVRVQAFADHTLRMKFEGTQLYHEINSTLDLPVGPVVSKLLLGYLEETVLVQLKRGHVKRFFVGREEPNAVTNIKRYFISQIGDQSGFDHLKLRWNGNGMKIEFLRKEAIVARLPLPSKTREETSLVPATLETTSSVTEGPVDIIRLCDSDKECPEGTRCLSNCNRWACVVQCIPCTGNSCDVTEKWWGQAVDSCNCNELINNPDCQLQFDEVEKTIMCRKNTSHSCRVAIEAWATAYKNAPNANDTCCKDGDPNYNGSQTAWNSCSSEMEGPAAQWTICDSDKDCPEGTRCLTHPLVCPMSSCFCGPPLANSPTSTNQHKLIALEGAVDQVRLCDSDKDCPEGTRCKSHCNRYACVVQCIPIPDKNPTSTNQPESTDVTCSSWPKTKTQLHGCAYDRLAGARRGWDWKELDWRMPYDSASCETLCKREREKGCCYLSADEGCLWIPGGSSYKYDGHTFNAIAIDCQRTGCADDTNGYDGYDCSIYDKYCSDSYTGDWFRQFRAACKSTCSRYASSYCTEVTCIGCADKYLGYDTATMKKGYNCEDYKAECRSDYTSEWSKKVRAACKNTCSHYASEYCTQNTCKAIQGAGFQIAAQGQSCSDIGQMSMKSGYECKEAATAFGKVIKSEINAQPGWCVFHNNEVYWDIQGAGLWKPESKEICSNDGWFPGAQQGSQVLSAIPKKYNPNYQVMSQETMSHNKAAVHRIKKSPKASIAKRIGEAATWTWDVIKTPFT